MVIYVGMVILVSVKILRKKRREFLSFGESLILLEFGARIWKALEGPYQLELN